MEQKPGVLVGKPVIKGTRISVEFVLDRLADGWTFEDLLEANERITREDLLACTSLAKLSMKNASPVCVPDAK